MRRRISLATRTTLRHSPSDSCGAISDAGYDVDGVATFEDAKIQMDVLTRLPNGDYQIRVTRK